MEEIQHVEHELTELKEEIKSTLHYITWKELDEIDTFQQLVPGRKRLLDTIKMIAYRAETAMTGLLAGPTVDTPAARRLLQDLFVTEADILPDPENKVLRIQVHGASRPAANRSILSLFTKLNEAGIYYLGTQMRLVYQLG